MGNPQTQFSYFAWDTPNGNGRLPLPLRQIKAGTVASQTSLLDLRYYTGTNTPEYDPVGNIKKIYDYAFGDFMNRQRTMGSPQTQTFGYDNLDRLTSAQAIGGTNGNYASETYGYDPNTGNLQSKAGVTYYYNDSNHAHAVTSLSNNNTYSYDANGNQTSRTIGGTAYALSYDAENRLVKVTWLGSNRMDFNYDGDGNRVKSVLNTSTTTTFVGTYYEVTGSAITKYYYSDTSRVAMRTSSGVRYIFGDHLGSTSITAEGSGGNSVMQLYKAWGEVRYSSGSLPTKYAYTGQYSYASAGEIELLYYVARFYDPQLGRFTQADTMIPEPGSPLAWDRYLYTRDNPIKYNDPSGHDVGNPGKDKFVFISNPNGYERPYYPDLWNDNGVIQYSTNCYAYALDIRTGFQYGDKLQPGQFSGIYLNEITVENVYNAAQSDAGSSGRFFEPTLPDRNCPNDTYKVALIIDPLEGEDDMYSDYHWLRLNPDETWSHKPGHQAVTNVDASGKAIKNPMTANFNYSVIYNVPINYSVFGGFYCIAPSKETSATDYSFP